jgi:hypothetical protein
MAEQKERPILFSAPMVRALLEGRKTQARFLPTAGNSTVDGSRWKNDRFASLDFKASELAPDLSYKTTACLKYLSSSMDDDPTCGHRLRPVWNVGELLYVRESLSCVEGVGIVYAADSSPVRGMPEDMRPWVAEGLGAMLMPRWASRITLEITEVRVQRLQEISNEDARAEGIDVCPHRGATCGYFETGIDQCFGCAYRVLWNQINGPNGNGWDKNPWVWAVSFKVVR